MTLPAKAMSRPFSFVAEKMRSESRPFAGIVGETTAGHHTASVRMQPLNFFRRIDRTADYLPGRSYLLLRCQPLPGSHSAALAKYYWYLIMGWPAPRR